LRICRRTRVQRQRRLQYWQPARRHALRQKLGEIEIVALAVAGVSATRRLPPVAWGSVVVPSANRRVTTPETTQSASELPQAYDLPARGNAGVADDKNLGAP